MFVHMVGANTHVRKANMGDLTIESDLALESSVAERGFLLQNGAE